MFLHPTYESMNNFEKKLLQEDVALQILKTSQILHHHSLQLDHK